MNLKVDDIPEIEVSSRSLIIYPQWKVDHSSNRETWSRE